MGPIDNKSALVQVMASCRTGNKPLAEPQCWPSLPTHISSTRGRYNIFISHFKLISWIDILIISCKRASMLKQKYFTFDISIPEPIPTQIYLAIWRHNTTMIYVYPVRYVHRLFVLFFAVVMFSFRGLYVSTYLRWLHIPCFQVSNSALFSTYYFSTLIIHRRSLDTFYYSCMTDTHQI